MRTYLIITCSLALILILAGCARQASQEPKASDQANLAAEKTEIAEGNSGSEPASENSALIRDVASGYPEDAETGTQNSDLSEMVAEFDSDEDLNIDGIMADTPVDSLEYSTGRIEPDLEILGEDSEPVELAVGATSESEENIDPAQDPSRSALVAGPIIPGQRSNTELIPLGWPDYIPIMEGFTILYTAMDESGMKIIASGKPLASEVAEYYEQLEGWQVDTSEELDASDDDDAEISSIMINLSRDDENLEIGIFIEQETIILQLLYTGA